MWALKNWFGFVDHLLLIMLTSWEKSVHLSLHFRPTYLRLTFKYRQSSYEILQTSSMKFCCRWFPQTICSTRCCQWPNVLKLWNGDFVGAHVPLPLDAKMHSDLFGPMPSRFVAHVHMELMLHAIPKQPTYHAAIKGRAFWKFVTVTALVPTALTTCWQNV